MTDSCIYIYSDNVFLAEINVKLMLLEVVGNEVRFFKQGQI